MFATVFFGNARHGKDTLAGMVAAELVSHGPPGPTPSVVTTAYAETLKRAAMALFGFTHDQVYTSLKDKHRAYGRTARAWLQWLGTEVGRNVIDRDLWAHRLLDRCTPGGDLHGTDIVLVTDGRFANEQTVWRERMGADTIYTVCVRRPSEPVDPSHESEAWVANAPNDVFDLVVVNDGDLAALRRVAKLVAAEVRRRWLATRKAA